MATENGMFSSARVIRSAILVDPTLNSRKSVDPKKIDKLAQSIKTQGLIQPPLLIRAAQLGTKYESDGHPYVLIVGFRRQAAIDINAEAAGIELFKQDCDYRIAPVDWSIQDAITANLTENLAREDLSSYELAMQCVELRDEYEMTAKDIANKVRAHDCEQGDKKPLSEAHINNLMRCATQLHPEILSAWEKQHPKATIRTLIALAAEKDLELQLNAWRGVENPVPPEEEEPGNGGNREAPEKSARRPSVIAMSLMMEAVKTAVKADTREPEFGKGAIAALRYASGLATGIPGVKVATEETED